MSTYHKGFPTEMKIAAQANPEPTEEDIQFIQQMGIDTVVLWTGGEKASFEYYESRRKLYEAAGITVFGFGDSAVHNQDAIVLNLPNRDAKIEEYKAHLRNLGKAGIPYTTYAHMANGIWSTEREFTRGKAPARAFNLAVADKGYWVNSVFQGPLTHGRKYSEQEIWDNFEYFIKAVVPVAEEAGVYIGIHPDDPPVPELGGIPRCIFSSFDGYKRALEIANSPNVGICMCCGTWLEGGTKITGKHPAETIRYFGAEKIWKIHFRNVTAPLPRFVETLMDNGYYDMSTIAKALHDIRFDGIAILDHSPAMVGGPYAQSAYGFAYMKAMLSRAGGEA